MDYENDFETEDEIDVEDDDDIFTDDCDGHPAWYEPQLCWSCERLFMPSTEDSWYCSGCESKKRKMARLEQDQ